MDLLRITSIIKNSVGPIQFPQRDIPCTAASSQCFVLLKCNPVPKNITFFPVEVLPGF